MSFNLIQTLSLTQLQPDEFQILNANCPTQEAATKILENDGILLEMVLSHLPEVIPSTSASFLLPIVCNEKLKLLNTDNEKSVSLINKITKTRDSLFSLIVFDKLNESLLNILENYKKGIPNVLGLKFEIQAAIAESLENHPLFSFHHHLKIAQDLLVTHFGKLLSVKIFPEPKSLIEAVLTKQFNAVIELSDSSQLVSVKESEPGKNILSFLSSLPNTEQASSRVLLEGLFINRFKDLCKKTPSFSSPCTPVFVSFRNEIRIIISLLQKLNLAHPISPKCEQAIINIADPFCSGIVELFKTTKNIAKCSNKEQTVHRFCLAISQKTILPICEVLPNMRNKLENLLFNALVSHFDIEDWKPLEESACFGEPTQIVIRVISMLHEFMEEKNPTLQSFTHCLDGVYLYLLPIQNELKETNKEEIVLDVFLSVLRSMLTKAGDKYESQISESVPILDLNDLASAKMIKRLKQYFEAFKEWFVGEIDLEVEMKVSNDVLITMIFQLISHRFPATTQAYIPVIRDWIEKNPSYNFKDFEEWLSCKITTKEKMLIKKNPEFIYKLFLKHALKDTSEPTSQQTHL